MKPEPPPLRLAVIGCGAIGTRHADAIRRSPSATLVAVCDVDASRAAAVAGGGARAYASVAELLASEAIDTVTVATPDHLHVDAVLQAIAAGRHVFCEKPLATTYDDAARMVAAAEAAGVHLAVDYNRRFGFGYRTAATLIREGRIGDVTHALIRVSDGLPGPSFARGPYVLLTTLLSHHVDLMRALVGEVAAVHATFGAADGDGMFGDVALSLRFAGDAVGTIVGGWRAGQTRTVEFAEFGGTRGFLQVDDVQRGVRLWGLDADQLQEFKPNFWREPAMFYDSLTAHLHAFIAALRDGAPPPVTGRDGLRGLEIARAAIASHETGRQVALPGDGDLGGGPGKARGRE